MPDKRKLEEIQRHIAEWRTLIATQKKRIADLQRGGHNAAGSITSLRELEASLRSMRLERGAIARRIDRMVFAAVGCTTTYCVDVDLRVNKPLS